MRKSLITVLTLVLVAVLAVPALGAELKVSGKYVGKIECDKTLVNSINAGGKTEGIDLLGLSTLYLTLDFAEGENVEGHIPLRLYRGEDNFVVDADPADSYWAVYRGYPFVISLSNQTEGDYAFAGLGDPLGLGDRIVALDDEYAVLKIAGQPYDVDTNAYVIYTKEKIGEKLDEADTAAEDYEFSDKDIRYALGRATYDLADGYTLGLTAGIKHLKTYDYECYNKDKDKCRESKLVDCGLDYKEANAALNLGFDVTGPLPVSEEATFTAALALGKTRAVGTSEWGALAKALEFNLNDMVFEGITFNAEMHLIDKDFVAIAPDTRATSESDVSAYSGNLRLYGEALATVNLFDMDFDIKAYDEYLINADTGKDKDSYNKIGANVEFQPLEPLKVDVGGYYKPCLDADVNADDFDAQAYGKGTYVFGDMLELWGRGTWGYGKALALEGYGFRLDGGFDATPLEGLTVSGEAAYQFKDYDFKDSKPMDKADRLDASLYAVAEQTLLPGGVEKVDFVAAGLAKGEKMTTDDASRKFVGYGHADITIDNRFSDKIAVVIGSGKHYDAAIHNKFTYTISENSALGVGCTYRNDEVAFDADYTVNIGESTLEVGYGKSGLAEKACTADDDKGKPWAWLCNAVADPKPYLFTLKITVPF
jgi:hypothetical protein